MILRCTILKQSVSAQRSACLALVVPLIILLIVASPSWASETPPAPGDDSTSAPGLDLGALASLAQNPQVINIISSLLSQNGQKSAPSQNSDTLPSELPLDSQNSISQDNFPTSGGPSMGEPLRRHSKTSSASSAPVVAGPGPPAGEGAKSGGLNSLMAMLPGLLPNLGSLSNLGNLGNLSSMLSAVAGSKQLQTNGVNNSTSASSKSPTTPDLALPPNGVPPPPVASAAPTVSSSSPSGGTSSAAPAAPGGGASGAISQVIAAYANGQIPSELIQMTLAGKIPSQVIDLALTGQLPPQLVQMAVTGQIPVSTMKAIFESAGGQAQGQANSSTGSGAAAGGAAQQGAGSGSSRVEAAAVHGGGGSTSSASQRSMARALLETLFRYQKDAEGKRSIQVPTILGSVPVQLPNLPRVRHIGQIVGGTITSVANMIPF